MTDTPRKTGRLEEPIFVRADPTKAPKWKPPPKPSPWRRHIELGRQNPARWDPATQEYVGGWMLVSQIKKSTPRVSARGIATDRQQIENWLQRHKPLERWQLRTVTVAGTICDRELYMRYLHTLTPEEDAEDRRQSRARYLARMAVANARKERRAAEARRKAAELEAASQIRIRGRRGRQH